MFKEFIKIVKHDTPSYAKSTLLFASISLAILIAATLIDKGSSGGNSWVESALNIVSPDPLKLLIGVYVFSLGLMAFLGCRIDQTGNSPKVIVISRLFVGKIAAFCKETTFIFFGFLIACGVILIWRDLNLAGLLISSLLVTIVVFFIFGIFDYMYKNFNFLVNDNIIMAWLQEILLGMVFIGLSFAVFSIPFEDVTLIQ